MRRSPVFLAAMGAAMVMVSCSSKSSPSAATKAFFDKIAEGKALEAFEKGTFAFKAQQSSNFFETMVKELGLLDVKEAKYADPTFEDEGETAKVRADFTTNSDKQIPLVVTLRKEYGEWRIFAVKSPRNLETGLVQNHFSLVGRGKEFVELINRAPAPDEATAKAMALETLLLFDDAIQRKNFGAFLQKCSFRWQDELVLGQVSPSSEESKTMAIALTPAQIELGASRLQRAFQPFIDRGISIAGIKEKDAVLDGPPEVSTDGLLIISGYYPTEPFKVNFSLKYTYQLSKWKLFGVDVSVHN